MSGTTEIRVVFGFIGTLGRGGKMGTIVGGPVGTGAGAGVAALALALALVVDVALALVVAAPAAAAAVAVAVADPLGIDPGALLTLLLTFPSAVGTLARGGGGCIPPAVVLNFLSSAFNPAPPGAGGIDPCLCCSAALTAPPRFAGEDALVGVGVVVAIRA